MIITKDILDEKVPKDMIPTRLDSALNLYTFVSFYDQSGILVYNINPDTWNCLYSFYELNHKFTLDDYTFSIESPTYRDLIDEYQKVYSRIYEVEKGNVKEVRTNILLKEYQKTFGVEEVHIGDELLPIYELKYSKSRNVWTLYYFENYVANSVTSLDTLLNQDVYPQKLLPLDASIESVDGIPLASNIPYLLSIDSNIKKLRNHLITTDRSHS